MNKLLTFFLTAHVFSASAQAPLTPDKIYGQLFVEVQMRQIFPDGKTFVDCTPKQSPAAIAAAYKSTWRKKNSRFSLKNFVEANFNIPPNPPVVNYFQQEKNVAAHINNLWGTLERTADKKQMVGSSLLPLPFSYIVPGGRFREIYYWDSYFTMLGLKESKDTTAIENMVKNFAFLIDKYGHIPNGNRSYYLSRSQPPFFSLMIDLLASLKGKTVYKKYLPQLQKEYNYWMDGSNMKIEKNEGNKHVVRMDDGSLLNRYWDATPRPRQESFREDSLMADTIVMTKMMVIRFGSQQAMERARKQMYADAYTNIRAAAESGMDFSTRWFDDGENFKTINTTKIVPVDLNALLFHLEEMLANAYQLQGNSARQKLYLQKSIDRQNTINKYCYDTSTHYYYDYHLLKQQKNTIITPAGMYPFCFFNEADMKVKAEQLPVFITANLLQNGGIITTSNSSGHQWDAPNGWAPMQWMTILGMERNGHAELAKDIAQRWIKRNTDVYLSTGKLMEKYDVMDTSQQAGGGEYPTQDGFGWTNGVLLALINKYGNISK